MGPFLKMIAFLAEFDRLAEDGTTRSRDPSEPKMRRWGRVGTRKGQPGELKIGPSWPALTHIPHC